MKRILSMIMAFLMVFALAACNKSESGAAKDETSGGDSKDFSYLALKNNINGLIANSKSVEELNVGKDKVVVKDGGEVVPGIYDLEVLEGMGNIMADRVDFYKVSINWIGNKKEAGTKYPSKFRVILLEGDEIEFLTIDKVRLTAVKDFTPSTELATGQFIVGKDILPGKYKLSSNVAIDEEYTALGWDIMVYHPANDKEDSLGLNADNREVEVELKEGDILTVAYNTSIDQEGLDPDDARLNFNPL